jgi:hypothetical protein
LAELPTEPRPTSSGRGSVVCCSRRILVRILRRALVGQPPRAWARATSRARRAPEHLCHLDGLLPALVVLREAVEEAQLQDIRRTSPSTCWKNRYSSRSDTAADHARPPKAADHRRSAAVRRFGTRRDCLAALRVRANRLRLRPAGDTTISGPSAKISTRFFWPRTATAPHAGSIPARSTGS